MQKWINKIHRGDCRSVLRQMIADKVQVDMCITSPPYWALRDYKTDPLIWDGDPQCDHQFQMETAKIESTKNKDFNARCGGGSGERKQEESQQLKITQGFCKKCGAWKGSLGLEPHFNLYIKHLCDIFDFIKQVLKPYGTLWVNMGDTYYTKSGSAFLNDRICPKDNVLDKGINRANELKEQGLLPSKCLVQIPTRFALEMTDKRGWTLRNEIIWHKPNCMPTSTRDRFTIDFEKIFFFTKQRKYYFSQQFDTVKESSIARISQASFHTQQGGIKDWGNGINPFKSARRTIENFAENFTGMRNKRTVWEITTQPYAEAHFATYPEELIQIPIKAGCPHYICKECGKPRVQIYSHNKLAENGMPSIQTDDSQPYAIKKRQGIVAVRKLPLQSEIREYLNESRKKVNITIEEIEDRFQNRAGHHWFEVNGSFPSASDWMILKQMLHFDSRYDEVMTKEYYKPAEKMPFNYSLKWSDCGCNQDWITGIVLDPFMGSGTTAVVACKLNRRFIGIELNPDYIKMAYKRLKTAGLYGVTTIDRFLRGTA